MKEDKLDKKFVKDIELIFDDTTSSDDYDDCKTQYFENVVYPIYERSHYRNEEARISNSD